MSNPGGFITLHRKMIDWEWYRDGNTKDVFIHLLLKANFSDTRHKGIELKRGQVLTSLTGISTDLGLTIQQARTALEHLKSTGEITYYATNQYRVITVVKYDDYQNATGQATSKQQANNKPSNKQTTSQAQTDQQHNNNINNKNNENNINKGTINNIPGETPDDGFDVFWAEYPKKIDKQGAVRAWKKIRPDAELLEQIVSGIRKWKKTDQWNKEGGQYIPYPATWLNKRKWEDEIPERKKPAPSQPEPVRKNSAGDFEQRDYSDVPDQMMADLAREIEEFKRGEQI